MLRFVLIVLCSVLVTGCAARLSAENEVWQPVVVMLDGVSHEFRELLANPGASEEVPYLRLSEGRVEGYGGCNQIAGGYRLVDNRIRFSQLASTRRACVAGMEREAAFLKALERMRYWRREDNSLILFDEDEEGFLVFVEKKFLDRADEKADSVRQNADPVRK